MVSEAKESWSGPEQSFLFLFCSVILDDGFQQLMGMKKRTTFQDGLSQSQLSTDNYPRDLNTTPAESIQIPESEANQKVG